MADKGEGIANGSSAGKPKGDGDNIHEIHVKTFTGITISLEVKPSDTIRDLKVKIRAKEGIPVDQQALIFDKMVLDATNRIRDFDINNNSTLKLMHRSKGLMRIFVKIPIRMTGIISLEAKPSDTICNVKHKIWDMEGISLEEQELVFNGMVLDDSGTLVDFDIKKDSTLKLMFKSSGGLMKIFVKNLSTIIPLMVKPTDTISKVKTSIAFKVGIPRNAQVPTFNQMVLEDTSTLADFNINIESTLTLMRESNGFFQIFVMTHKGRTITLGVKHSDTIDDLKAMIQEKTGLLLCQQELIFNGRVLDNNLTIVESNIHKQSTIRLVIALKGS